jgi:DNA-binding transcriptional LysR family regulator
MSRSLASEHLRQLEDELGVRLVNRTTRQLVLTEIGEEYLALCLSALKAFDEADARVNDLQNKIGGSIKVMASMAFAIFQLGPVIVAFNRAYPAITVSLVLFDRSFYADEFIEGGFDVGVSTHPMRDADIISTKIVDASWVPCATRRYLDAHPRLEEPADLAHHTCLLHQTHAPDRTWTFVTSRGKTSVPVSGPLVTNSSVVLRDAVLSNLGIAMLPHYGVRADIEDGRMVRVLPDFDCPARPTFLVYPQTTHLPKRTRLFIDFVRRELKSRTEKSDGTA